MTADGRAILAWAFLVLTRVTPFATAQALASPAGNVAQTVDRTTITIRYYRPTVKGRELFGGVVQWGESWTPGANWATTLEVDTDVRLNNQPLPAGTYSVWFEPRQNEAWVVKLSRMTRVYHLWPPPPDQDQLRLMVDPEKRTDHAEVLTWTFPVVMRDAALIRFQWGSVALALHVAVPLSRPSKLSAEERAWFVGEWKLELEDRDRAGDHPIPLIIVEADGALRLKGYAMRLDVDDDFELSPIGGRQFHPIFFRAGKRLEPDPRLTFVFSVEDEQPLSFEVRGPDNRTFARGFRRRLPAH